MNANKQRTDTTESGKPNEIRIAGESEVALWYCDNCFRSGALLLNQGSVYSVIEALVNVHRAVSKDLCDVTIGSLRLIKPVGWYGQTHAHKEAL